MVKDAHEIEMLRRLEREPTAPGNDSSQSSKISGRTERDVAGDIRALMSDEESGAEAVFLDRRRRAELGLASPHDF